VRVSDFSLGGVEFGEDHRPSPQKSLSLSSRIAIVTGLRTLLRGIP